MRNLKLACLVTLLMVAFVSVGAVNAQTNEATVTGVLSKYSVSPGGSVVVTVTVQNNVATQFSILRVGMHADFMGQDSSGNDLFLGPPSLQDATLGSSPYQASFLIEVPVGTALGAQNFYIGVDAQDSSGEYYSWNSQNSAFQVVAGSGNLPTPTPSGTNSTGGNDAGLTTTQILMYVAIVAIVAMLILALLVLITLRRRRNRALQKPESKSPPEEPKPEPEPQGEPEEQKPAKQPDSGENFDI